MRKLIFASCLLMGLAGCQTTTLEADVERKPVSIRFGGFDIEVTTHSRATLADACTALNYYRYTDGTQTGSQLITASDDGFGTFTDEMPWGTHKLYFIGHKTEVTSFADGIASFDKVNDTFTYAMTLEVDEDTDTEQTITLVRRVAKFELVAKDALPDNLASVDIQITGGAMSVDVESGIGGDAVVQTKTITVPASNIGKRNCIFSSYLFLPEGVTEVDITVITKDADGEELVEYLFEDVEVKRNTITRYSGMMFGKNPSFELSVDAEWDEVNEWEF